MYYQFYEWNQAFLMPARMVNDAIRLTYKNPLNPLSHTEFGRQVVAAGDVFERLTRRYGKPEFGLDTTTIDGKTVRVEERIVWERPFCRLVHFARDRGRHAPAQSNLLIVAPMSGHYATLLRGTVEAFLPHHEVYITDWVDARIVPLAMGGFDLDDYIDYLVDLVQLFSGNVHIVAVCQPAVPVFAATALLEQRRTMHLPRSITLMGGPIDTRENPTEVNLYAAKHDLDWFRRNVIMTVPFPHPGFMRRVYPGFLQLTGFMTMNFDRHLSAHYDYFDHLVKNDGDGADKHRTFYDEYLSVMDLTEEFYLQTVDAVFLRHALPKGEMVHRGRRIDPSAIRQTPILTVEGELDDISGLGQTKAAHRLTPNLPDEKHAHYEQASVGHYGVFNGSRFRREIAPRITEFATRWDDGRGAARSTDPLLAKAVDAHAKASASLVSVPANATATLAQATADLVDLTNRRRAANADGKATHATPASPGALKDDTPTDAAARDAAAPAQAGSVLPPPDEAAVDGSPVEGSARSVRPVMGEEGVERDADPKSGPILPN